MKKLLNKVFDDSGNGYAIRYLILLCLWMAGLLIHNYDLSLFAGIVGIHLWFFQSMRLHEARKEVYERFLELERLKEGIDNTSIEIKRTDS